MAGPCDSAPSPHLVISEVATHPNTAEFIEIWNPSSQPVNLTNYFISDNSVYHTIAQGPWDPTQTAGTDFVAQFPEDTVIGAGEVLVVQAGTDYEAAFPVAPCPAAVMA